MLMPPHQLRRLLQAKDSIRHALMGKLHNPINEDIAA
jgi:hypothetical protein